MSSKVSGKMVTILIDQAISSHQKVTLPFSSSMTVGEARKFAQNAIGFNEEKSGFTLGLALPESSEILFSDESSINQIDKDVFLLKISLVFIPITIEETGKEEIYGLDPTLTIRDTIAFIEFSELKGSVYGPRNRPLSILTPKHELLLQPTVSILDFTQEESSKKIRLEMSRTIKSYRISPKDRLILVEAAVKSDLWKNMSQGEKIPCIIFSEEFNISKTIAASPDQTFDQVLAVFFAKSNIQTLSRWYCLYLNVAGQEEMMNPDSWLAEFPLPTPARMTLKTRSLPHPVFNCDPEKIPKVEDLGVKVPYILADLKELFLLYDGVTSEGIFRKAGNEVALKAAVKNLNKGIPFYCRDQHTIATLLKRWFKGFPRRIFSHVSAVINTEPEKLLDAYLENLTDLEQSLFKWLLELLVDVAECKDVNKMDCNNLGIVWGPGMVGSNDANDMFSPLSFKGFDDTQLGVEIISSNVKNLLDNQHLRPLCPKRIVTVSTSSASNESSARRLGMQPGFNIFNGEGKGSQLLLRRKKMAEDADQSSNTTVSQGDAGSILSPPPSCQPSPPNNLLYSSPPPLVERRGRGGGGLLPPPPVRNKSVPINSERPGTATQNDSNRPPPTDVFSDELKNALSRGAQGLKKAPSAPPEKKQSDSSRSPAIDYRKGLRKSHYSPSSGSIDLNNQLQQIAIDEQQVPRQSAKINQLQPSQVNRMTTGNPTRSESQNNRGSSPRQIPKKLAVASAPLADTGSNSQINQSAGANSSQRGRRPQQPLSQDSVAPRPRPKPQQSLSKDSEAPRPRPRLSPDEQSQKRLIAPAPSQLQSGLKTSPEKNLSKGQSHSTENLKNETEAQHHEPTTCLDGATFTSELPSVSSPPAVPNGLQLNLKELSGSDYLATPAPVHVSSKHIGIPSSSSSSISPRSHPLLSPRDRTTTVLNLNQPPPVSPRLLIPPSKENLFSRKSLSDLPQPQNECQEPQNFGQQRLHSSPSVSPRNSFAPLVTLSSPRPSPLSPRQGSLGEPFASPQLSHLPVPSPRQQQQQQYSAPDIPARPQSTSASQLGEQIRSPRKIPPPIPSPRPIAVASTLESSLLPVSPTLQPSMQESSPIVRRDNRRDRPLRLPDHYPGKKPVYLFDDSADSQPRPRQSHPDETPPSDSPSGSRRSAPQRKSSSVALLQMANGKPAGV